MKLFKKGNPMKFNRAGSGYGVHFESMSFRRFAPAIAFSADDGGGGGAGGGGGEDLSALKSALAKERAAREKLENRLKAFDGLDPENARHAERTLREQIEDLQLQLDEQKAAYERDTTDLTKRLTQKDVGYQFTAALSDMGVLPEYRDRFNDIAGSLEVGTDGKLTRNGQPFNPAELRAKYPAMFKADNVPAGSGSNGTSGRSPNGTQVVAASSNSADPNDMISGKVVLDLSN
jgi:hypothetical protein